MIWIVLFGEGLADSNCFPYFKWNFSNSNSSLMINPSSIPRGDCHGKHKGYERIKWKNTSSPFTVSRVQKLLFTSTHLLAQYPDIYYASHSIRKVKIVKKTSVQAVISSLKPPCSQHFKFAIVSENSIWTDKNLNRYKFK